MVSCVPIPTRHSDTNPTAAKNDETVMLNRSMSFSWQPIFLHWQWE